MHRSFVTMQMQPEVSEKTGVPWCSKRCPSNDGKRCTLMGYEPSSVCEPAIEAIIKRQDDLDKRQVLEEDLEAKIEAVCTKMRGTQPELLAEFNEVINAMKQQLAYSDEFHEHWMISTAEIAGAMMRTIGIKPGIEAPNANPGELMGNQVYQMLMAKGTGPSWWRKMRDKEVALEKRLEEALIERSQLQARIRKLETEV